MTIDFICTSINLQLRFDEENMFTIISLIIFSLVHNVQMYGKENIINILITFGNQTPNPLGDLHFYLPVEDAKTTHTEGEKGKNGSITGVLLAACSATSALRLALLRHR